MMATQNLLCHSLLKWLETFPNQHDLTPVALSDGVVIASVLNQIEPDCFHAAWLSKIKGDVGTNWRLKVSNLRKIQHAMVEFQEHLGHNIKHFLLPDLSKIGEHNDLQELGRLLQLVLGCAINCSRKQEYIEAIMGMEESVQAVIMAAIQELYSRTEGSSGLDLTGEVLSELGPASFHPHLRTVLEQLESALQGKEEFTQRCHALEHQVSVLNEENSNLKQQRESLFEKFEALQVDTEMGGSTLRNKDLKKQVENLQDELFKAESTREEYKVRADELEKENQDFQAKNEELQTLAEQARSLKDEVDALRDMSEKVVVYEGTVETYKKKLEELSDLKRQIKLLEQKNSDYMQQNMELEEEVKKSGTWRPQLEMYKRQVADLHQKLAEETKHTDRQAFDNKKLTERLEALHQEKERLMSERESLKEMIEELKCNLTLSTDASSRLPSDLSDLDLLEVVPPEIREKLMRLQYENKVLKQQTSESSSSQVPVLEAMVNDLQERHLSVTQENRWDSAWPSLQQMLRESRLNLAKHRNVRVLKKNLKWASESDLVVVHKPHDHFASLLGALSIRPSKDISLSSSFNPKKSPIVIRHIHEFRPCSMAHPEDSGYCRTSPSSCDGCDEHPVNHGCYSPGPLSTLDSGVSDIFRCMSPAVQSLAEECTTHHLSSLCSRPSQTPSPVFYHSHPSHSVCHCSSCMFHRNTSLASYPSSPPCSPTGKSDRVDGKPDSKHCVSPTRCRIPSMSRSPLPPESPTPHNSPRLPSSVHASRSRAFRASDFQWNPPVSNGVFKGRHETPHVYNQRGSKISTLCISNEDLHGVIPRKSRSKYNKQKDSSVPTSCNVRKDESVSYDSNFGSSSCDETSKTSEETNGSSSLVNHDASPGKSSALLGNSISVQKNVTVSKSQPTYLSSNADDMKKSEAPSVPLSYLKSPREFPIDRFRAREINKEGNAPKPRNRRPLGVNLTACNNESSIQVAPFTVSSVSAHQNSVHLDSEKPVSTYQTVVKTSFKMSESFRKNTQHFKAHDALKPKEKPSPVTLLTDTLFTNFVVSQSSLLDRHGSERASISIDTDNDVDAMEAKLLTGVNPAPIVTSESCTTDDLIDTDLSVSEYCADDDLELRFIPHEFKPYSTPSTEVDKDDLLKQPALVSSLYSTKSQRGRREVKRKSHGFHKKKYKGARVVFSEAFNAMFAFCTP